MQFVLEMLIQIVVELLGSALCEGVCALFHREPRKPAVGLVQWMPNGPTILTKR